LSTVDVRLKPDATEEKKCEGAAQRQGMSRSIQLIRVRSL
jgi:hypothetical protein